MIGDKTLENADVIKWEVNFKSFASKGEISLERTTSSGVPIESWIAIIRNLGATLIKYAEAWETTNRKEENAAPKNKGTVNK